MVQDSSDSVNNGVLVRGERGPAQSTMFADENLLVGIWVYLKPTLSWIIEATCMLLVNYESHLCQTPLFTNKCFKKTCSCAHTKLGECSTRYLTLIVPDAKWIYLVILLTTWSSSRKRFTLLQVTSFLGLASNLILTTQWEKIHTHLTATHRFHRTEVQFKNCFQVENTST